jgi:hypothetical protein
MFNLKFITGCMPILSVCQLPSRHVALARCFPGLVLFFLQRVRALVLVHYDEILLTQLF